jgi:hypothetical protein
MRSKPSNPKEIWHVVKVLEACHEVTTQMRICGFTRTSNFKLKYYLKKLQSLGFIKKASDDEIKRTESNGASILWVITKSGKMFQEILQKYVDAK